MALFDSEFLKKLEYLSLVSKRVFRGSLMAQRRVSAGKIGPSSVVAMPATTKPMCKVIVTADGKRGPGTDVCVWATRS